MTGQTYIAAIIFVVALVTAAIRFLPFLLFRKPGPLPAWITYLGAALPPAVMAVLVVYCLRGVNLAAFPFGLPEGVSVLAVILLYLWKRNNLISIGGGTLLYMLLIQVILK